MDKDTPSDIKTLPLNPPLCLTLPSETGRDPFDLSSRLAGPGIGPSVNLPVLLEQYLRYDKHKEPDDMTRDRYYKRLYRHLQKLAGQDLLILQKGPDNLVWTAPNNRTFNLIREKHFSNFQENKVVSETEPDSPVLLSNGLTLLPAARSRPRAHMRPERARALRITRRARTLAEEDHEEIHGEYQEYRREIDNTILLFKRREDLGNIDGEVKTRPYETRFNSLPRKIGAEKKYKNLWNNASVMYNRAVFLTLTTDPGRHGSVEEANKAFGPALNQFMTWVRKKIRAQGYGKLSYISANEFQKNGLLHAHIVIFGIRYLEHYKKVSYLWSRTGQGKIVYLYGLRRDSKGWYWVKKKPKDAEPGQSCSDYLKKYLSKNLQDDGQDLYWLFGKRFFTNSKTLESEGRKIPISPASWVYIGSCHWSEVPGEVERYNQKAARAGGPPGPGPPLPGILPPLSLA